MLALLVLGMVVNPALASLGGIHALDHTTQADTSQDAANGGHSHLDDHAHPQLLDGGNQDATGDEDEGGLHSLMHLSHGCATSTVLTGAPLLELVPLESTVASRTTAPLAPLKRISEPFRPPIS